eukprot:s2009_g3.t1
MGDHLLGDRLSCSCTVCITWRRLGLELSRGHSHQGYLGAALSRLRLTFNDLLDYRAVHGVEEPPVAGGGTPAVPPIASDLLPPGDQQLDRGARVPGQKAKEESPPQRSRSRHRKSPSKKKKDKKKEKSEKPKHREEAETRGHSEGATASSARAKPVDIVDVITPKNLLGRRRPSQAIILEGINGHQNLQDHLLIGEDLYQLGEDQGQRESIGEFGTLTSRPLASVLAANNFEKIAVDEKAAGCSSYRKGDWILLEEAVYFKQTIQAAGRVVKEEIDGEDRELQLELTGTKSEDLLKFATGQGQGLCRLHLCRSGCDQTRENPDLLHGRHLQKLPEGGEKTWEINLLQERETDLLRADHERWRKGEEDKKKRARSTSSSRDKKEKKKKKKKKKEEKEVVGEKASPERKKARLGSKAHAQKSLEACFANTGLDPNQRVRQKIARRAKRALRKSRDSSTSTSSGSSSKGSSGDETTLLEDRSKVHRLADRSPGVLTAASISTMARYLTQVTSTGWETGTTKVPPLFSLYTRVYVSTRLSGGQLREFMTLSHASDLLLQGRVSESLDILTQRMKSLELVGQGTGWQLAQKLELIPPLEAGMSSRQEHQIARRENRLDQQVKGATSSTFEKGKGKSKGKTSEKGKDKGKTRSKEGDNKKVT